MGRALVLAAALLVASCGFQPLYGERTSADGTAGGRIAVSVGPIPERKGQAFRAALRRAFDPTRAADYRMEARLREQIVVSAVDDRGDAIRKTMTMTAEWRLWPIAAPADAKPLAGSARAFEAFNVLQSDFANVKAERAARLRAVDRLAEAVAQAATARIQEIQVGELQ